MGKEREIRGQIINGYLDFVKKTWGKDGLEDCRKAAGLEDIKLKDGQFYSNEIMMHILTWIKDTHGIERVKQAGNFAVKNLGMFAYLVRFINMEKMLGKAEERYREMYHFGKVSIKHGNNRSIATMRDVSTTAENCIGWQGAFEAMLEMTKSKGTVTHTKCQMKGDDRCEYIIDWK